MDVPKRGNLRSRAARGVRSAPEPTNVISHPAPVPHLFVSSAESRPKFPLP